MAFSAPRPRALFVTLAATLGVTCAHAPAAPTSTEPEITTYDVELGEQSVAGVKLIFPWSVRNPAAKTLSVTSIAYKLAVEGEPDVAGSAQPKVSVAPQGNVSDKLVLDAPLATTEAALSAHAGKTALRFNLSATFTLATESGPQDYEAEWFGDIFPPQKPEISVVPQAARYGSSASKVELTFTLVITNPNPFPLPVEGLDYVIEVADIKAFEGTVAQGERIAAGAERELEVSKVVGEGTSKEDKSLALALQSRAAFPYRFEGNLRAGSFALKKTLEGQVGFAR
ncbi:MAG: LEA type 2 family protein [Deltaproteobacteria bacterium]|nr:LEA type 2 family protein [Deltaproteobacteria bacterium]